eukprot:c21579_g1_i1 orf=126-1613(+)
MSIDYALSSAPKPHVIMMPFPLQGHITPLMQLSKLLAARGFAVTFVTSEFNVKQMREAKQELKGSDLRKLGIELVGIPDGRLGIPGCECMVQPQDFLASLLFLHTSFDELVGRMVQEEGLTITCIISDSFLVWTQDVANKWRIPRVAFWPNSLATLSCCISLPTIMAASPHLDPFKPQVYESAEGQSPELLNCIPGISQIAMCRLPFHTLGGEDSEEWLREHVPSQMERVNEPLCFIANSFPDLEREIHNGLKELLPSKSIFTLGPLLPTAFLGGHNDALGKGTGSSLCNEDTECMQWLDKQAPRSVIYISFGSIAVLEEREVREIALGLAASQQPFLWVLRSAACEPALAAIKKQGKVIRWAPQLRVLSHEAVGGFLTHCGWNSTLESVGMGVPVIGWPQMMDQMTNCWFLVEKLKVGVRIELDESMRVGHAGVERAVRTLMQEEEGRRIRARASKFHTSFLSAFTTSLPSNLDSFVDTILSSSTNHPSLQSQA